MDKLLELYAEHIKEKFIYFNGNLIDLIAADNGWKPLDIFEEMTVTFNEKCYIIVRIKDAE